MTYQTDSINDGFVLRSGNEFLWVDQCLVEELIFAWGELHEATIVYTREDAEKLLGEWNKDTRCEPRDEEIVIMKAKMNSQYTAWYDNE